MKYMRAGLVGTGFDMLYDGFQCDVGEIELLACLPEEWKKPEDNEEYMELDYIDWPKSNTA
jgi:hypothetical protein